MFYYVPGIVLSLLYVNLFNSYDNPILPYFTNWETKEWTVSNLPKVTRLVRGRAQEA